MNKEDKTTKCQTHGHNHYRTVRDKKGRWIGICHCGCVAYRDK